MSTKKTLLERFEQQFTPEPNSGCWLWVGALIPGGYGAIGNGGRTFMAHRVSYQLFVGSIPDGLHLDHKCRVKSCVNPAHLEPVTAKENAQRALPYKRFPKRKTHCPKGHPYSGENVFFQKGYPVCRECSRMHGRSERNRELQRQRRALKKTQSK